MRLPGCALVAVLQYRPQRPAQTTGFLLSFVAVTSLFILFADLLPKRVSMAKPEALAVRLLQPMLWCMLVLKPLVWLFDWLANAVVKIFRLPAVRDERITSDDILAMTKDGTRAGVLAQRAQQVIANVMDMNSRTVPSAMTQRDRIAYFLRDDPDHIIRARIAEEPYSTYPVCDGDIDHVIGYVDAKDLFQRALNNQPISLAGDSLVRKALIVPDRLTLSEVLEQFRQAHEDFAVVVNEYSRVVGVLTLNDVMSTVMGDLVSPDADEEQIVRRDANSWLIDGITPIDDVLHALQLDELPHDEEYATLAGFLMVMLRRVPRRTDSVDWGGYKFEVIDVDSYRIDQVLVTRLAVILNPTVAGFVTGTGVGLTLVPVTSNTTLSMVPPGLPTCSVMLRGALPTSTLVSTAWAGAGSTAHRLAPAQAKARLWRHTAARNRRAGPEA